MVFCHYASLPSPSHKNQGTELAWILGQKSTNEGGRYLQLVYLRDLISSFQKPKRYHLR